jgi:hypothetical protein
MTHDDRIEGLLWLHVHVVLHYGEFLRSPFVKVHEFFLRTIPAFSFTLCVNF